MKGVTMTLNEIEIYAQDVAVISHVNEQLGTTFAIKQLRGRDFTHIALKSAHETIMIESLDVIDKVCVGLLAVAKELGKG